MEPTQDEALLTAYLDGELSPQERQAIEQRLAHEPELRQRFVLLEETWNCLDLLEQDKPNSEQIEDTLHLAAVSLSATALVPQKAHRFSKWGTIALVSSLLLLFAIAFQFGRHSPLDDPSFRPMVERLDWYLAVSDDGIELVRQLAMRRVFLPPLPKDVLPIDPVEYMPSRHWNQVFGIVFILLFGHLDAFDETVPSPLFYKNIQRFQTLSPEKVRQVCELHQAIQQAPQSVELIQTLQNYYNWSKSLQSYEKAELKRTQQLGMKIDSIIALKHRLDDRQLSNTPSISSEVVGMEESAHLAKRLASLQPQQQEMLLNSDPMLIINELKHHIENEFLGD